MRGGLSQLLHPFDDQGEDGEHKDRHPYEKHVEHEDCTPEVEWFQAARKDSGAAPTNTGIAREPHVSRLDERC